MHLLAGPPRLWWPSVVSLLKPGCVLSTIAHNQQVQWLLRLTASRAAAASSTTADAAASASDGPSTSGSDPPHCDPFKCIPEYVVKGMATWLCFLIRQGKAELLGGIPMADVMTLVTRLLSDRALCSSALVQVGGGGQG